MTIAQSKTQTPKKQKQALLDVHDLSLGYTDYQGVKHTLLHDFSCRIRRGEFVAIVGESGAGKSIAAKAVLNMLPDHFTMDGGHVQWHGDPRSSDPMDVLREDPFSQKMRMQRLCHIGYVPQEPMSALSPIHTIETQMIEKIQAVGTTAQGGTLSIEDRRLKAIEMLESVGFQHANHYMKSYGFEFSGGMRQRVLLAMALVNRPKLLIADEPTTALDVSVEFDIMQLLKSFQKNMDLGILFITHDLALVENYADYVIVLKDGEMMEYGPVKEVLSHPKHPYTLKLLGAQPRFDNISLRQGHKGNCDYDATKNPLITTRQLQKTFVQKKSGKQFVLGPASLQIFTGEVLGVVGESGSGKTSLIKMIAGIEQPDHGTVIYSPKGEMYENIGTTGGARSAEFSEFRSKMGFVFQDPFGSINPRHQISQILSEPLLVRGIKDHEKIQIKMLDMLDKMGLPPFALSRYPYHFSGGQRQRIAIARALMTDPEILICDEPTSALDVTIQRDILNLLQSIRSIMGLTMIFVSHDLKVISEMSDRIIVMYQGMPVEVGSAVSILTNPLHPYTKHLLSRSIGYKKWDDIVDINRDAHTLKSLGLVAAWPSMADRIQDDKAQSIKSNGDGDGREHDISFGTKTKLTLINAQAGHYVRTNFDE